MLVSYNGINVNFIIKFKFYQSRTAPVLKPLERLLHTEILNKIPACMLTLCPNSNYLSEFLSIMTGYYRQVRAKVRQLHRLAIENDAWLYVNQDG